MSVLLHKRRIAKKGSTIESEQKEDRNEESEPITSKPLQQVHLIWEEKLGKEQIQWMAASDLLFPDQNLCPRHSPVTIECRQRD